MYLLTTLVVVLLLSDGVMCALTGVTWLIQLLVAHRHLTWNREGWIVQHVRTEVSANQSQANTDTKL